MAGLRSTAIPYKSSKANTLEDQRFRNSNQQFGRKKGQWVLFAFSFSKPAHEEVARCKQEEGIVIEL